MRFDPQAVVFCFGTVLASLWADGLPARATEHGSNVIEVLAALDTPGGLVVQLGASQLDLVTELARTGRFVIHVVDRNALRVEHLRRRISDENLYGWVSADQILDDHALPYTENLVNLVVLQSRPTQRQWREIVRVLRPDGLVLGRESPLTRPLRGIAACDC